MRDETELHQRLRNEARFQDERLRADAAGQKEPRSRFYFLAESAFDEYQSLVRRDLAEKKVLVVGCSDDAAVPLAKLGADATAIDISPEAVQRMTRAAERKGLSDRVRALEMNAEDLVFAPETFDLICCSGVLHHLDVERAASSWARCLKTDGRVVMVEPLAWHPIVALYRLLTPSMRTPDEHPLVPRDFATLRRHFGDVRFTGHVLTSVLSLPWAYLGLPRVRDLTWRLLTVLDKALLTLVPPLRYLCWTTVVELRNPVRSTGSEARSR